MISSDQIDQLQNLQLMVLIGSRQTGIRLYHDAQAWRDGAVWSAVRAVDDDCAPMFSSTVAIGPDGHESAITGNAANLTQQRDQLAEWIAANRISEEAA